MGGAEICPSAGLIFHLKAHLIALHMTLPKFHLNITYDDAGQAKCQIFDYLLSLR